jgi:hypothetical protein
MQLTDSAGTQFCLQRKSGTAGNGCKKEKPLLACRKPGLKKEYDSLIFQGITAKEILYKCGCNNKDKLYRQNAALGQNLLTCCHEVLKKLPEQ